MKIITPQEMARIEKVAYQEGESDETFMENAGAGIAEFVQTIIEKRVKVTLLCGKGNNAGDALVVGRYLLEAGYDVSAYLTYPQHEGSSLFQLQAKKFKGKIVSSLPKEGLLIDGLLGTGFRGKLEEPLLSLIKEVNESHLPIIAIDIPSGLDGETGIAAPIAIKANWTTFLGLPKLGFFFNEGLKHVGQLIYVSFGLSKKYIEQAISSYEFVTKEEVASFLPLIEKTRHKYQRGYVVGISGSHDMPGAACLASLAALRGGAGIVKIYSESENPLLAAEVLRGTFNLNDSEMLLCALNEAGSVFIGPGLGKNKILSSILPFITKPLVLDADALNYLSENTLKIPSNAILTPHLGEMKRLLKSCVTHEKVQNFSDTHHVIIVLKGAPTFIFSPNEKPYINSKGDPGMATAGSGDVLTGLIAALLSQKVPPKESALLGTYLHGRAGEIASCEKTSYNLIASDIIDAFPLAFKEMLI